eukprot:TRINITY_DN5555_c0_g1_i1.p1 TRINITY_DN5555_c0_g1~~TRINITY_DN5555_c0_g1_i1.p1  ORF type:complete len:233 (+),score=52.79 TRINITY_DN5555_c0_g1_i1:36-701(+)
MATFVVKAYPRNTRIGKALIAAQFNGIKLDWPQDFSLKEGHHLTPEFLALNPFHQVPTLQTPEGGIFESNSIARFVAREGAAVFPLYGKNNFEASRIDGFLDVMMAYDSAISPWFARAVLNMAPRDAAIESEAQGKVKKILLGLNTALAGRDYLVGDSVSLADVCVASAVGLTMRQLGDSQYLADVPNVVRYIKAMLARPQFVAVMGESNWTKVDSPPATA